LPEDIASAVPTMLPTSPGTVLNVNGGMLMG